MSLKKTAASGVKWTSFSTVLTTGLQFIQLAVLARLLSPEAFGLMAMIMVVLGFAQAYADMGISNAIIHRQDATKEQLSSLYWLNILAGVIVFLLLLLLTPPVVLFFGEPRLTELMHWATLIFLITPLGQQFQILLQKELQFRTLAIIDITATFIGTITTIVTALMGQGVFSIIWGQLGNTLIKTLMLAGIGWKRWPPKLRFKYVDLHGYLGFGLYQMGEKSINYFSANIDYLLIGRFLGSEILGVYTIAYQLVILPLQKINPVLTRVAFPIFAKKQNDNPALRRGFVEITKLLLLVVSPLLIGMVIVAPIAIPVVLGNQWVDAVILVQILAIIGILKTLGNPVGSIWLAKGRADLGFKWNIFVATTNLIVFWLLVKQGVLAIAWAYVILSFIYFVLIRFLMKYIIGLEWSEYLSVFKNPVLATLIMGFVVQSVFMFGHGLLGINIFSLMLLVMTGAITYSALIFRLEKTYLKELVNLLLIKKL